MSREATSAEFTAAAERVVARYGDLFKRLAIRDHHVYDRAVALGFTEREHVPELSDRPIQELVYLARVHEGQHQYVSLCHYEGRFLEAVVEVFWVSRNGKAKRVGKLRDQQLKGAAPLYVNIARDWETLEGMVSKVYALAPEEKKQS